MGVETSRDRGREREKKRERGGQRRERGGEGERKRTWYSKTLILKDSSVRSIWTYLTASPCYTTNTNKLKRERERQRDRERERERTQNLYFTRIVVLVQSKPNNYNFISN